MKREAERLQLAKSGYADSQLADPEVPQEPDIEALCAKAARTYDLTRREEDVLRLLVEGRTAPQIAEELVVSPNPRAQPLSKARHQPPRRPRLPPRKLKAILARNSTR